MENLTVEQQNRVLSPVQSVEYLLLSYNNDGDRNAKLEEWERCYNFARPHDVYNWQTSYQALKDTLQ